MTKRQITILIVLGMSACATLTLVLFLYLNVSLFSISSGTMNSAITDIPISVSSELPTVVHPTTTSFLLPTPTPLLTDTPVAQKSLDDGIYIVENPETYLEILPVNNDSVLDISTLPTTSNSKPIFAVKGNKFQIEDIKLRGYYAGIGIHSELVSLGSGKMGAKIIQIYENSPASEAGLNPDDIIIGINGEAFTAMQLNFALAPYRDLVDLINPNQNEITIDVLSGTTERSVTVSRTYRPSGDNFKTNQAISSITIEPNGDYVLLKVTWPLKPGIYRFEFEKDKTQKWIFIVR